MNDQANAKPGLTDAELAVHPTVYAPDALKGQVAVVSGGSGGIGRAIAWLLARLGAHVVVVGREQHKLDVLAGQLAGRGRPPRMPPTSGNRMRSMRCSTRSGPRMAASTASSTAPADNFRNPRSIFR
jgi:NAD(P)-dependent dehydrogenase (short-subunit alcohol dehydrogenase family)